MHLAHRALPVTLASSIVFLSLSNLCLAAPVLWSSSVGGNNHYYEFVTGNISWTNALAAAASRQFLSANGYLATITSFNEKEFLRLNVQNSRGWLGGFQDTSAPDYSEPAGGWRWITGEPWVYTNWASPEPNEHVAAENFLEIDPAAALADHVGWNDVFDVFVSNQGYYAEYTIPEPSSFASALLLLPAIVIGRIHGRALRNLHA